MAKSNWRDAEYVTFTTSNGDDPVVVFAKVMEGLLHPLADTMVPAAEYAKSVVKERTMQGINVTGITGFAPYSPKYAKRKGSSNVDLYGKGSRHAPHMLDAVDAIIETEPMVVRLVVTDPLLAMIGKVHQEGKLITSMGGKKSIYPGKAGRPIANVLRKRLRQFGFFSKGGHFMYIPMRPWLGVTPQDTLIMGKLIAVSLQKKVDETLQPSLFTAAAQ
jgi:hypothetical protein